MHFSFLSLATLVLSVAASAVEGKYAHDIEQPPAALAAAAAAAHHNAYQFHKRQSNSTITTSGTHPTLTGKPTPTTGKNGTTTGSETKFTTTATDEDGNLETITSTRLVPPTGDEDGGDPTPTTKDPGLQTAAAMELFVGGVQQIAAVAAAAVVGAWML